MATNLNRKGYTPFCLALITCDQVIQEGGTGKHSIIGSYSTIVASSFPCLQPRIGIFLAFTDGLGEVPFKVVVEFADDPKLMQLVFEAHIPMNDPRQCAEFGVNFGPVAFPKQGLYLVRISADDQVLMERRLVLTDKPPQPPTQPNPTGATP